MEIGQTIAGKIVRVLPYGAMVQLENGVSGLVHISEIAEHFIKDIHQHCSIGARVVVYILRHGADGRWEFSLKRAQTADAPPDNFGAEQPMYDAAASSEPPHFNAEQKAARREAFDEKMRDFLDDSSERLEDARRHQAKGRGGKGKRR